MRIAALACAFAGHLVAGGPWLSTVSMSTFYAEPDSVFMVLLLTGALEWMLFVLCVMLGVGLRHSRWRHVGTGLLIGWFAGVIAVLGGGTALIWLLAALI
jgi:hypothetical protein